MNTFDWSKFLSVEVLTLALISAGGITVAWSDVKSDITANTTTIQEQKEQQTERYKDLKDGQKEMRGMLNELLLNDKKENTRAR